MDIAVDIPDKLAPIAQKQADFKCVWGGRGSGKSWSIVQILLVLGVARPLRILGVREFQTSIKESSHQLFTRMIERLGLQDHYDIRKTEIHGKNGTYICYVGLHDQTAESIKGYEDFDIFWIDEARTITRYSWQLLCPTMRKEGGEIWATLNPEDEDDPVYADLVVNTPDNCITIECNWWDNPWFPERLRRQKDADYRANPEDAAWIWEGKTRNISDAQILKGKIQVVDNIDTSTMDGPYYGLDFGFATDPTALIEVWVKDDSIYIAREVYGNQTETDDLPALLDQIPGIRQHIIRADSSRPETISYLRRQGFRVMAADKWSGSVNDGIAFLRRQYRIYIHHSCRNIIKEGKYWRYKVKPQTKEVTNVPASGDDHGWDAVRYSLDVMIRNIIAKTPKPKNETDPMTLAARAYGSNNNWMGG